MLLPVADLARACALAIALTLPALAAPAPATPVPIEKFFSQNSAFSGAKLAPDARSLAVLTNSDNGRERLAVIDLVNNSVKVVAQFTKADIGTFEWVNNQRLVFNSNDKQIGPGDARYGPGLYAVDKDGKNFKQLVDVIGGGIREHTISRTILPYNHYLAGLKTAQDSNFIYVYSPKIFDDNSDKFLTNLVQIDTVTGRATTVARPGTTVSWLLDHKGAPRLATTLDKNLMTVHYLDPVTTAWRRLVAFDGYLGGHGAFDPVGFAPDGSLYVNSHAGGDLRALYTFDFKASKLSAAPVIALDGFDFSGSLLTSTDKLLGITYLSDARATVWFDDKMKAVQAAVDALLPDTVNLIRAAPRAELPLVLVSSYSDRQPYRYSLFNTATGKLMEVGQVNASIKPSEMASQEIVRIKARDGMSIPAWLTVPDGPRQALPLVVLVHGGPYVRGVEWGWRAPVQFLASRGYAVLEPEFRGSTGYGAKLYRAGFRQWGLAMQNDIADATKWAIAQGIVDPKRICIAGASYGGYATLMGLINDPDLYQCGINWVGVTDIDLLYSGHWSFGSDVGDAYKQYGMPTLIGDRVKDAAQFKVTSPLAQASRIKQPLLLAYGAVDQRVPLYHGRLFHDAVKAHNPNVEMVVYDEEGHGWTLPKNSIDFWGRVEKFLDKNIGKK